jgi:hypothetical protein
LRLGEFIYEAGQKIVYLLGEVFNRKFVGSLSELLKKMKHGQKMFLLSFNVGWSLKA